jgi:hypothetical protein
MSLGRMVPGNFLMPVTGMRDSERIVLTHCTGTRLLRHQLQLCTRTPTAPWSLRCAGRVVQDRSRQQHKNGPAGRLYLWKEWSTHTAVDASSTQDLTFPFSSSHNVHSLPHFWKFAHFLSKNRTVGSSLDRWKSHRGFPRNPLSN